MFLRSVECPTGASPVTVNPLSARGDFLWNMASNPDDGFNAWIREATLVALRMVFKRPK